MAERCKVCEQYEKSQAALLERRVGLWRRGMLTDAIAEELDSEQRRIMQDLKEHQTTAHEPSRAPAT